MAGLPSFRKEADYEAFERIMIEAQQCHRLVNEPLSEKEAAGVQVYIARNRPYGNEHWQETEAERLGLLHTLRSEGRPKSTRTGPDGKN